MRTPRGGGGSACPSLPDSITQNTTFTANNKRA